MALKTCTLLKSDLTTAEIPIIFLSALDDVKSKVAGLKVGGVDYISKPMYGERPSDVPGGKFRDLL